MGPQVRDASWGLLGRWLLGTLIGWFVGILLAIGLSYAIAGLFYAEETNLIVGFILGAVVAWLASVAWAEAGLLLGGVVLGAVSGSLLVWMLRSAAAHETV